MTRADKMFHVAMKAPAPTKRSAPVLQPKYKVTYKQTTSNVWHEVQSPYCATKGSALVKFRQHLASPLRQYRTCSFRIVRLKDNQVIKQADHQSLPKAM